MKILIVTKNWLGDMLFQVPAIERVRKRYPDSEIVCMTPFRCREMIKAHPDVNRTILFDEKREHRFFLKRWGFAWTLARERFDRAYLFHRSRTRAILVRLAGVPVRIGYDCGRKKFLTESLPEPAGPIHEVDYFLSLTAGPEDVKSGTVPYHFYFSKAEAESAARKLKDLVQERFAVFHLGANWEPKRWPPGHFAALADRIAERWGFRVLVTGGPQDSLLESRMRAKVQKAAIHSLVGQTTLGELGAIFQKAAFVVSGDSGPMHVAAGVGAPVLALFGPTDPARTGPRGVGPSRVLAHVPPGCQVPWYPDRGAWPKEGWLEQLRPEEVFKALQETGWVQNAPAEAAR